jgi:hypothetical protein
VPPKTSPAPDAVLDNTYSIYSGVDHFGTVGTVAPGLFAQVGRCWRMVDENPVGHGTHCMEPVAYVGRRKFLEGWTNVCSLRFREHSRRADLRRPRAGDGRRSASSFCARSDERDRRFWRDGLNVPLRGGALNLCISTPRLGARV